MSSGSAFCSKCGKPLPAGVAFCPSCGAAVGQASGAQSQAPLSGVDAVMKDTNAQGYWIRRVIAYAVDAVIVYVAVGILALLFAVTFLLTAGPAAFWAAIGGAYSAVVGVILFFYFTFADAYMGATVGKSVFSLKVVGPQGKNPTLGESAIRNISKLFWLLLLLDVIVGLALSKKYTQKYSDQFAKTEVIETPGAA